MKTDGISILIGIFAFAVMLRFLQMQSYEPARSAEPAPPRDPVWTVTVVTSNGNLSRYVIDKDATAFTIKVVTSNGNTVITTEK